MPSSPITLIAAGGFATLAGLLALFHLCLAFGAPWGQLTLGGRWPGVLPRHIRPLAVVQAAMVLTMALAILDRAGIVLLEWPGWVFISVIVISFISLAANAASPSRPERRTGVPVAGLLLLTALLAGYA